LSRYLLPQLADLQTPLQPADEQDEQEEQEEEA
jgi:hypothetical protein